MINDRKNKIIGSISFSLLILFIISMTAGAAFYFTKKNITPTQINVLSAHTKNSISFDKLGWLPIEEIESFNKIKKTLLEEGGDFIEVDLSKMILRYYREGQVVEEYPVISKGKSGSWWETPTGLYQILTKKEDHFSSFGQVYMPWSMQFQGNFFIHGWPYYPDGTAVPEGHSGGCIRLSDDDAKEIYKMADNSTPILIIDDDLVASEEKVKYDYKKVVSEDTSYLVADLENNFILIENLSEEKKPIGDLTKLMTALVAVEYINVEKSILIEKDYLIETFKPRLSIGDRAIVLDLLSLMLVESSNEASKAIASYLGNDYFINLMNNKSVSIGLQDTKWVDYSGIEQNNISTAIDLFLLTKYLYNNRSFILDMTLEKEERTIYGPSKYKNLFNINKINGDLNIIGSKVDIRLDDLKGLNALVVANLEIDNLNRPIAIIVLGSDNIKKDIENLYKYTKDNFVIDL